MSNTVAHNFQERLDWSQSLSDEPAWLDVYRKMWPDMLAAHRIDANSKWQKWGIDRVVYLPNGKQIFIDEKKREFRGKVYDDFLCEIWSVWRGSKHPANKVGWTLDREKHCEYIAYAVPQLGSCRFIPFELLRLTARKFYKEWINLFGEVPPAQNNGYVTRNVAVPWPYLAKDMETTMRREFGNTELALPTPTISATQTDFDWSQA